MTAWFPRSLLSLALLFATGWLFARFTLGKPWVVGLSFLIGGGVLVALVIALGG